MYRLIEHIWNGHDYNQKKLYESDDFKQVMNKGKTTLKKTESIRIEEGFYDALGDWQTIKEFDDIDIREYGESMATKKVTISLTPGQQDKARFLSRELFGKENISGLVGFLIERLEKEQKTSTNIKSE